MNIGLNEIHSFIGGTLHGTDMPLTGISIDTRTMLIDAAYIAIQGEHFDGHDFVEQAFAKGAKAAIVHKPIATELPHILVDNTRLALTRLARAWRQKCGTKIIGVTGSNGKTTVKEMIAAVLRTEHSVLSTQGNFNNDIGVPLTLLQLTPEHEYGVIEMGANHLNEIADLAACALPDFGVITNVGPAHIEGFGSIEGVAKGKGEMYAGLGENGVAIVNADEPFYDYWQTLIGSHQQLSFGFSEQADITANAISSQIDDGQFVTDFVINYQGQSMAVQIALAGQHNVMNALAASAVGLAAGLDLKQIKSGLAHMQPVTGRLQPMLSSLGNIIINDSYNANPASLKVALEVLTSIAGEHWVILGAFGELGAESKNIHKQMGELIKSKGVVRLAAVGPDAESTVNAFGKGAIFFNSLAALIDFLKQQLSGHEVLLIKGSRVQRMEQVSLALTEQEVV